MSPETHPPLTARALGKALATFEPLQIPALPGRRNHLHAGVLLPIAFGERPTAIATLRPTSLARHGGEVCFPGGRREEGDEDLAATALREAHEELGIEGAEILGRLSAMPVYTSDYRLVPFVAAVDDASLRPDPGEVARVLRYDLLEILERPGIEAIPYSSGQLSGLSPVFRADGEIMFGATAHSFLELLELVAPLLQRPMPPLRPGELTWPDLIGG